MARETLRRHGGDLAVGALLVSLFAVLKSYSLNPAASDENIYFYDAWLMTRGEWPYRDFFFAHPPLHLIPGWLLMSVAPHELGTLKILSVVPALGTGLLVYVLVRPVSGRTAAVVATAALFVSHDYLRASSHWTGINNALLWMTAGMLAAVRGRHRWAGALYGAGAMTGMYVLPGAAAMGVILALGSRRAALGFAIGFGAVFAGLNLLCLLLGGRDFFEAVYLYHLNKPAGAGMGLGSQLWPVSFHNLFIVVGPVLGCASLALAWRWRQPRGRPVWTTLRALVISGAEGRPTNESLAIWMTLHTAAIWCFLAMLGKVFHFYFLLFFAASAVCIGLAAGTCVAAVRVGRVGASTAVVAAGLLFVTWWVQPSLERQLSYFEGRRGSSKTYERMPSALGSGADAIVEALFWEPERTIGERTSGILFYLWHESRTLSEVWQVADWLRGAKRPGETMIGDSTTAPLIALLAGLRIANNEVDTNGMRFHSGITSPTLFIERLRATYDDPDERLTWAVVRRGRGFFQVPEIRRFIEDDFEQVHAVRTRYQGELVVYRRRQ